MVLGQQCWTARRQPGLNSVCGPWEGTHPLRRAPEGWLGSNLNVEPSIQSWTGVSHSNCAQRGLCWTAYMHCFCPLNPPDRGVPGVLFQPTGLIFSLSHQSWQIRSPSASLLTNQSSSIMTKQDSAIWTNQTVRICSPHLHRPIRGQGWGLLSIHASSPLAWIG